MSAPPLLRGRYIIELKQWRAGYILYGIPLLRFLSESNDTQRVCWTESNNAQGVGQTGGDCTL